MFDCLRDYKNDRFSSTFGRFSFALLRRLKGFFQILVNPKCAVLKNLCLIGKFVFNPAKSTVQNLVSLELQIKYIPIAVNLSRNRRIATEYKAPEVARDDLANNIRFLTNGANFCCTAISYVYPQI